MKKFPFRSVVKLGMQRMTDGSTIAYLHSFNQKILAMWRRLACLSVLGMMTTIACGTVNAGAIEQLRTFAAETRTAKGMFTQRVVSRNQKASEPNTGEFVFARPGKFRWTYLKPYEQVLVADGEKLSIYDKDLNQVTIRKLGDALGGTPAGILFGTSELDKTFNLKDSGTRDGIEWLEATPKAKDSSFEKIAIGFRNGELAAMELRDALGQITLLTFANVERNPVVSAETFKFVPPKGTEVLQN